MEVVVEKNKGRKGLISKTWELCRSMSSRRHRNRLSSLTQLLKSRSLPARRSNPMNSPAAGGSSSSCKRSGTRRQGAPEGYFTVYVGPERQRFVIKTKYAGHPLFKMLLEEAELEYGYNCQGPLALPCEVDMFCKVLSEMDCECDDEARKGCSFVKRNASYHLLTPPRMLAMNGF